PYETPPRPHAAGHRRSPYSNEHLFVYCKPNTCAPSSAMACQKVGKNPYIYEPPLMAKTWPVICREYSEASTNAPSAISSTVANRPSGISLTSSALTAGSRSPKRSITSSVSVNPGIKQLTWMSGASSRAKHLVNANTPALAAQKLVPFFRPRRAEAADTL